MSGKDYKQVYNLEGGIRAWKGQKAFGPKVLNMDLLRGDESPTEITVFAYSMETALGGFYRTMAERTTDEELKRLFTKLAGIEQKHKEMLFALYSEFEPSGMDLQRFESNMVSPLMEGGFNTEDFLKQNEPHLKTAPDVLNVAMIVETQSLDLYLRYADGSTDVRTKDVLFKIADEEKAHLAALGRLLEEKV